MRSHTWLGQLLLRVQNIWSRGLHLWPASRVAEYSEQIGATCPLPREAVFRFAQNRDDFPCPSCEAAVKTSDVDVSEIFTDVVQAIRRGRCSNCGAQAEFETRFYRGSPAVKHGNEWYVMIVRPSLLERIWRWLKPMR